MKRVSLFVLLGAASPAIAQIGPADGERMRPVAEYLIPEAEEITLALSAAPANVADGAEVHVFRATGYARVREGKSGLTCIVQRAWSSPLMKGAGALFWSPKSRFPICYNARAAATIMSEYLRRTELALAGRTAAEIRATVLREIGAGKLRGPAVPAIAYMLSPETVAGTGVRPLVPHFMLYLPFADDSSLGPVEPGSGLPVSFDLMGTSFATFVMLAKSHPPTGGPDSAVLKDRAGLVDYLEKSNKAFLSEVAALSEAQMTFKPSATSWSIAEIMEHLVTVERETLTRITNRIVGETPLRPELKGTDGPRVKDLAVRMAVTNRTAQRFTAPDAFVPKHLFSTRAQAVEAMTSTRAATIQYARDATADLRGHFAVHPIMGVIDAHQWILFFGAHTERHHEQMMEVKSSPLFPRQVVVPPTNPKSTLKQFVGPTEVEVSFSRPGVKGRQIFGKLVPWNQVWRTGSDNATRIRFSTDVTLNGVKVPAGAYELFTIPDQSEWTVIVHQNKSQWGSYSYSQANDVARIPARPVALREAVETFNIGVSNLTTRSATLNIEWERTRVPVTIEVDVAAIMVPQIEAAMQAEGRKPYFLAAMFYFENNLDINKAAEWITAAVGEQPNHIGMLHRQALILEKKGDTAGALAAARRSLEGSQAAPRELKEEYTRLNTALIDRLAPGRR